MGERNKHGRSGTFVCTSGISGFPGTLSMLSVLLFSSGVTVTKLMALGADSPQRGQQQFPLPRSYVPDWSDGTTH